MEFKINNKKIIAKPSNRFGFQFKFHNDPIYFTDFNNKRDVVSMVFVFKTLEVYFLNSKKELLKYKKMYPFISFSFIPEDTKYIVEIPSNIENNEITN